MLNVFRASRSNILVWVLMVLLIVGLAGFGISTGGLGRSEVARVGGRAVSAGDYARALEQEVRAVSEQLGRPLGIPEARQFGVDRMVLARLVGDAALDEAAAEMRLSTGDATVRAQVTSAPAFQGAGGAFDASAYTLALQRIGLTPAEFESELRREATRNLIVAGVQSATDLPDVAQETVLAFLGERRGFDWTRLDPSLLSEPVPAPTQAEIAAEYAAYPERYTRPATRRITYASLTPAALAERIEVPEDELRAAYAAESGRFSRPERRVLDRIGFADDAEAAAARARLDAGEIGFDALAAERGLTSEDLDQGTLAADALGPEARAAVFGAGGPGIVGPVATPLGPSIYRINGILAATSTPFEEARAELLAERTAVDARDLIAEETAAIEDLVAGGATVEEIAAETEMDLGEIGLNAETIGPLAGDPAFRTAAEEAEVGVETDLVELGDGGIVTLRVDAEEPAAPIPLAEVRDRVIADWTRAWTTERLTERAGALAEDLAQGTAFAEVAETAGLEVRQVAPLTRGEVAEGAPAELVAEIFEAAPEGTVIRADGEGVILAQLTQVMPFDPQAGENPAIVESLSGQFRQQAGQDLLALYIGALRDTAGLSVDQDVLDATLEGFQ